MKWVGTRIRIRKMYGRYLAYLHRREVRAIRKRTQRLMNRNIKDTYRQGRK